MEMDGYKVEAGSSAMERGDQAQVTYRSRGMLNACIARVGCWSEAICPAGAYNCDEGDHAMEQGSRSRSSRVKRHSASWRARTAMATMAAALALAGALGAPTTRAASPIPDDGQV